MCFYIDYTGDIDCGGCDKWVVWTHLSDPNQIIILSKHNTLPEASSYKEYLEASNSII